MPRPFPEPLRPVVGQVALRLPVPPSVNALHRHGRGAPGRSPEYVAWITAAGWTLLAQRPGRIEGPYELTLRMPATSRADLGNLEKAVSDLLQEHGVIGNDRNAEAIHLRWHREHDEAEVVVLPFAGVAVRPRAGRAA